LDCDTLNKYEKDGTEGRYPEDSFHPDCQLTGVQNEKGEVRGTPSIRVKSEFCNGCGHSFQAYLHVFTETERKHTKVRDEAVNQRMSTKAEAIAAKEFHMKGLEATLNQWRRESDKINQCLAMFPCFLCEHALTPFNDAFEAYMEHLIELEKKVPEEDNRENANTLEKALLEYNRQKEAFQKAHKKGYAVANISPEAIHETINKLCQLELCGPKIRQCLALLTEQKAAAHSAGSEVQVDVTSTGVKSVARIIFSKIRQTFS